MNRVFGAMHDLDAVVRTHLFGVAPNNSGSSFLKEALATCRGTWNLEREGQHMLGFVGPTTREKGALIWSVESKWLERIRDRGAYDWPRTRKAWYFQAFARDPLAPVFYTKAPPFLFCVDELARHFHNAKFLFMARNPYAVCEGICRNLAAAGLARGRDLPTAAARHVVNCLDRQRRNIESRTGNGVFFSYEEMCDAPEAVEKRISGLVPELGDLNLRQRLSVKRGSYDEMLTNMNRRQIARLEAEQIAAFNRVFGERRDLFDYFGYELMQA